MSETTIVAILAALFGFLGGLVPSIASALKLRTEAHLAARKSELDELKTIIDELQEELKRRKTERLAERGDYDRRLAQLSALVNQLECEIGKLQEAKDKTERENVALRTRVRMLEAEVKSLRDQVVALGGRPKTGPLILPEGAA